jgi:hypothetical protein
MVHSGCCGSSPNTTNPTLERIVAVYSVCWQREEALAISANRYSLPDMGTRLFNVRVVQVRSIKKDRVYEKI